MVYDISQARLPELLDLIEQLYDKNLVDKQWAGEYKQIKADALSEIHDYHIGFHL
ncbi:MAG: hypothetical protein HC803_08195 [Saprospiraceae bacterium]|nr:hypothetical protein [Saprospiraceae bacterium]